MSEESLDLKRSAKSVTDQALKLFALANAMRRGEVAAESCERAAGLLASADATLAEALALLTAQGHGGRLPPVPARR